MTWDKLLFSFGIMCMLDILVNVLILQSSYKAYGTIVVYYNKETAQETIRPRS